MGHDLKNPRWMYVKAIGFVLIASLCAAALIARSVRIETLVLILLLIWSSARAYYFCFYVIQQYIDPSFKYSGVGSMLRYLIRR